MKRKTPLEIQNHKSLLESLDEARSLAPWSSRISAINANMPAPPGFPDEATAFISPAVQDGRTIGCQSLDRAPLGTSLAEALDRSYLRLTMRQSR